MEEIEDYFCHRSCGYLRFDPRPGTKYFRPWWALVECDDQIIRYYAWFLKKRGVVVDFNMLWGAHVSAIKGEEPANKELWGKNQWVEYFYTNRTRLENDKHAWLDVYSPQLKQIRIDLGLPVERDRFHMTIGRVV